MQMVRTYVSFEADFPDDGEWDDRGNVISPPGLAIAKFLQGSLTIAHVNAGAPENHEDFGWEFGCTIGRTACWVLIQNAEPWLIIVHLQPWLLNTMRGGRGAEALRWLCLKIHHVVKNDIRFREVKWFTREEYERRPRPCGASEP